MVLHGRIILSPLSSQILYHDYIPVIVSRFTSLIDDFVICCYQVTKISARSTAVPVRFLEGALVSWFGCKSLNFCPSEIEYENCASSIPL